VDNSTNPAALSLAEDIIPPDTNVTAFWEKANMLMVMIYWTTLGDLGQLNWLAPRNTSHNVYLNMTMLQHYTDIYNRTYPGYIQKNGLEIIPYNATFSIPTTMIVQDYTCNQLQRKAPLSIIVVLLGGLYLLLELGVARGGKS
jgi:hypothetical protein